MKKQTINIGTIIVLFLIAMVTSPRAGTQIIVFVALLAVIFGRDLLLKKPDILSRDESVA
jgi:Na+-translocating ferredoxin:NAD+ oxidoreductase RnfD subunit